MKRQLFRFFAKKNLVQVEKLTGILKETFASNIRPSYKKTFRVTDLWNI